MKKYIITIIVLLSIILLSICGYFVYANEKSNQGNSQDMLKDKAITEIKFLNTEIIGIMNELSNISYTNYKIINQDVNLSTQGSENTIQPENNTIERSAIEYESTINENNDKIDWESIKETTENIYSSWTTILIDLTTLNVNRDNLLKFNDLLDEIVNAEEDKNKEACLSHLANLYNLLALYLNDFSNDEQIKNIFNTKSNILYAYSAIDGEDWNQANEYIEKAKSEFNKIMNNQVNNINNIDEINKAYILINELSDDINKQSKKTFFINYVEVIQELENI